MEPETWQTLAAVAGAVGTPVVAIWLAKINQQNLDEQRRADDARAENQREHDVQTQQRSRRASLADERVARLRADASEFVAVLDEAWRALKSMEGGLLMARMVREEEGHDPERDQKIERKWHLRKRAKAPWNDGNVEHRLSIASARLRLLGGEVAQAAEQARDKVMNSHFKIVLWGDEMDNMKWPTPSAETDGGDAEVQAFVEVVQRAEQEILDPGSADEA